MTWPKKNFSDPSIFAIFDDFRLILRICFTFVKTPLQIKVVQYVSWKHEIVETITSLLIKTLANLEKEVEKRRFYHYANNTDTNVVITISRRILLADWDCRAWMMMVVALFLWNTYIPNLSWYYILVSLNTN